MTVKLKNYNTYYGYCSAFHCVDEDMECFGSWTTCKDFVTEYMVYARVGKSHYYNQIPKHNAFDRARIVINKDGGKLEGNPLHLVNQIDTLFGFELTTMEPTTTRDWLFVGDPRWVLSPPMFGLWNLLQRNGTYHISRRKWRNTLSSDYAKDYERAPETIAMIDYIAEVGPEEAFGTDLDLNWKLLPNATYQHNEVGPLAFIEGRSQKFFPHWKGPKGE